MISKKQFEEKRVGFPANPNRVVFPVASPIAGTATFRTGTGPQLRAFAMESEPRNLLGNLSFLVLGLAQKEDDEPFTFCVITWYGPASLPSGVRMFVSRDWQLSMSSEDSAYVADLLADWKRLLGTQPATLLNLTRELSVGPVRTMHEATMIWESATNFIKQRLKDSYAFPFVC